MINKLNIMWILAFSLAIYSSCLGLILTENKCLDHKGNIVAHGDRYFPMNSDPCTQCRCSDGNPEMCIAVFCSPPDNCRLYHVLNDKCCEFVCLDGNIPQIPSIGINITDDTKTDPLTPTNLGLRLVASAVTSFLILALLLFMIHRLRQRRLLLVIRRLNGHRLDTAPPGSQRYSRDDDSNVGYFVGHDQLDFAAYDEPPPPYSFWKPPETYIPTGEAPPPYEMTVRYPPPVIVLSPSSNLVPTQQEHPFPQPDHVFTSPINCPNLLLIESCPSSIDAQSSTRSIRISPDVQSSLTRSENDFMSDQQGVVIDSDVRYEDLQFSSNNVTILQCNGATNSTPSGLCEDDIVNGNVLLSSSVVDSCCSTASSLSKESRSRIKPNESRSGNRCHSYCEGLGQWREEQTSQKQPLVTGSNNNVFPDPTAWGAGDASESSTTSSPSSDQQTVSPTSSDSSPDADFTRNHKRVIQQDKKDNVLSGASGSSSAAKKVPLPSVREKRNSLERTIKHLKRFSLPGKKSKSNSSSVSGESVNSKRLPSGGFSSSRNEANCGAEQNSAFVSEGSCSTSPQSAEEENAIQSSTRVNNEARLQTRCKHYRSRPASLNLNSWYISSNANHGKMAAADGKSTTTSESSQHCSTASSADSIPVDNIVQHRRISYGGKPRTLETPSSGGGPFRCLETPSGGGGPFRCLENRAAIGFNCGTDAHLQALQQRRVVARSSSICSETGEHNPRRLSIPMGRTYRHSSDSTPEYVKNFNSPSQNTSTEQGALDNLRIPMENYRRSSESSNSGT